MSLENKLYEKLMYSIHIKDKPNTDSFYNQLKDYLKIIPNEKMYIKMETAYNKQKANSEERE